MLLCQYHHADIITEEHNQSWASGKLFPWKTMPSRLASSGLVLINWPEGVMFPGDQPNSRSMAKGISDLGRSECQTLITALNGKSKNNLHVRRVSHQGK